MPVPAPAYTPINWVNGPAGNTPLSMDNLNHMDQAILTLYTTMVVSTGTTPITGTFTCTLPNATPALSATWPATGTEEAVVKGFVTGDTQPRVEAVIRADGWGSFKAGPGAATTPTAEWYAQSAGWRTPGNVTIDGVTTMAGGALTITAKPSLHMAVISTNDTGTFGWGFKHGNGVDLAQIRGDGFIAALNGFQTGAGQINAFHVTETYAVVARVPVGAIVCPWFDGRMASCPHPGCAHALIACEQGGLSIGEEDDTHQFLALIGRVPARAHGPVSPRDWVMSDGTGAVRAMLPDEHGMALGYAVEPAGTDGTVLVLVRATPR